MPEFLWFYVLGLSLAAVVGGVCYFAVGGAATSLFNAIFDRDAGHMWGRSFRMMILATATIGGLSVQWHGCDGYTDYSSVAENRGVMIEKTTEQVAGASHAVQRFLIFAAAIGAVTFAVLARSRLTVEREQDENTTDEPNVR